jgi:hypothetical protein
VFGRAICPNICVVSVFTGSLGLFLSVENNVKAMEGNIDHGKITEYSQAASTRLMRDFFDKTPSITGRQILQFCEVQQINLFVLKALFDKWKAEFDQLRSPYFDYKSPDVLLAARRFMNVLSKHILINRDEFAPLLEQAIYKTVLLIFSPYEYYLQEINKPTFHQVNIADLTDIQKYIKINGHLLKAYIARLQADSIEAVFNDEAVRLFDEVCERIKDSPEDFEPYHRQLQKLAPLNLEALYSSPENEAIVGNEPAEQGNDAENINERFKSEQKTLLDLLPSEPKKTIADIHETKPAEGIRENITINQRFMFEGELFDGDKDEYEMVINYLDQCKSRADAMDFINENYVQKKHWDLEKTEAKEFFALIDRRFPH